jgi:hypothetical protein
MRPLLAAIVAGLFAVGGQAFWGAALSPLARLLLDGFLLIGVYLGMLFYVMGQKAIYVDLLKGLLGKRPAAAEKLLVSA